MKSKFLRGILAGCVLALPLLAGCSGKAPPMSKEDQANFKGSPMPADRRSAFFNSMHSKMKQPSGPQTGQAAPNAANPSSPSNAQQGH